MLLITNADDLGYSTDVNQAARQAHEFGTLTSASLMVTGDAAHKAVSMARDLPGLAVGLHLALSHAKSVLPPDHIPNIVDSNSNFSPDPFKAGLKYYFSGKARRQLQMEIEAQFEAFASTGLPLSHVDGHQHMHAHPLVLPVVIKSAIDYGAIGIRIPREPMLTGLLIDYSDPIYKLIDGLGHAYLSAAARRMLGGTGLAACDICIGGLMSGRMSERYVTSVLRRISEPKVEVYFHPSLSPSSEPYGPNTHDLATLTSSTFSNYISQRYTLANYRSLCLAASEGRQWKQ